MIRRWKNHPIPCRGRKRYFVPHAQKEKSSSLSCHPHAFINCCSTALQLAERLRSRSPHAIGRLPGRQAVAAQPPEGGNDGSPLSRSVLPAGGPQHGNPSGDIQRYQQLLAQLLAEQKRFEEEGQERVQPFLPALSPSVVAKSTSSVGVCEWDCAFVGKKYERVHTSTLCSRSPFLPLLLLLLTFLFVCFICAVVFFSWGV